MRLVNKNILLISPEPWNHIFVSKHHYATHLAERGNQVVFLNPPSKKGYHILNAEYNNLRVADYPGFWKGLRFFPKLLRKKNESNVFKRLEKIADLKFDIIWSFDNSVFFDFDALPDRIFKISHIVDLNQDFEFGKASRTADLCLGVIPGIVDHQKIFNNNSHLIRHGVSLTASNQVVQFPGSNRIKVLYFGNLAMSELDWPLLRQAAMTIQNVDFILLGSNHCHVPELPSNVFLLNEVPSTHLHAYMKSADLLMLFYKYNYNQNYASPHKILEYLSSGKPIVSTTLKDFDTRSDLVIMGDGKIWIDLLNMEIQRLNSGISEELSEKRIAYALENTYDKQIDRIEKILTKHG